jgi:hypothetical protein
MKGNLRDGNAAESVSLSALRGHGTMAAVRDCQRMTGTPSKDGRITVSGEEARGGEIILRQRWQRGAFIFGLALPAILLVILLIVR